MNTITTNLTLIINSAGGCQAPLFKTIPADAEEEYGWSTVCFCMFEFKVDCYVLKVQLRDPSKTVGFVPGLFIYPNSAQLIELSKTNTVQDASLAVVTLLAGELENPNGLNFALWSRMEKNPALSRYLSVFRSVESFQEHKEMSVVEIDLKDEKVLGHMAEWIEDQSGSRGILGDQIYRVHCEAVYRAALFLAESMEALSTKRV